MPSSATNNRPWKNRRESSRYTATKVSGIDWGTSIANSFGASFGKGGNTWAAAAAAARAEVAESGDIIGESVSSRYDPRSMNLVPGINEEIESSDSDDDSSGNAEGGVAHKKKKSKKNKRGLLRQQPLVILGFIAIIVGVASFQMNKRQSTSTSPNITDQHSGPSFQVEQERLLEIAEQVISACSEQSLNADMKGCQQLCLGSGRLCCWEDEESDSNCGNDESMNCAAYVGCKALVSGFTPKGAAPMSEQRRVRWG